MAQSRRRHNRTSRCTRKCPRVSIPGRFHCRWRISCALRSAEVAAESSRLQAQWKRLRPELCRWNQVGLYQETESPLSLEGGPFRYRRGLLPSQKRLPKPRSQSYQVEPGKHFRGFARLARSAETTIRLLRDRKRD